jgi:hypothetical protein
VAKPGAKNKKHKKKKNSTQQPASTSKVIDGTVDLPNEPEEAVSEVIYTNKFGSKTGGQEDLTTGCCF